MNSVDAAKVLAAFHGAYPNIKIDDAVATVWQNALFGAEYGPAMAAAQEWINSSDFWPSVAQFNGMYRRHRSPEDVEQRAIIADGSIVTDPKRALECILMGFRSELHRKGLSNDEIDATIDRRLPTLRALAAGAQPGTQSVGHDFAQVGAGQPEETAGDEVGF